MIRVILFDVLLFGVCGYALLRGKWDARIVAMVCVIANFASYAVVSKYASVETGVLIIDLLTFAAFTLVALRSERFWPLWISGLQLTTSLGHLLKGLETELVPIAYAAALRFWSYPILIILAVGTWRQERRARAERQTSATA
jgi:nicotinamide riboside transporter PnuC